MSPTTQRRFLALLAAGGLIQEGESYQIATRAPSNIIVVSGGTGWNFSYLAILVAVIIIISTTAFLWLRVRKDSGVNSVATQTDNMIEENGELYFTPHGECYHKGNCQSIQRNYVTKYLRRPCSYRITGIPDPEIGTI
jgi:hypothetical protein